MVGKDSHTKVRFWENIAHEVQNSPTCSVVMKSRSKKAIHDQWDKLFARYKDVKDKSERTGNHDYDPGREVEFWDDFEKFGFGRDPSVKSPFVMDSLKRKGESSNEGTVSFIIMFFGHFTLC